ncbi:pectinesterase-like [Panicum miliaceum]|uniref:Pectinesterase n=1 Tax=Panicum miliaceum TaxID=4540 RepID=A0A3L6TCW7_PANMI|nr:pectinesterase-like [Panicum miliaceum]
MSSSAFGDFGPLTERRKAEKARQQRRRIMIAVGTVSIIILLIVMGAAAISYSGKSSSEGKKSSGSKGSSPSKGKSGSGSSSGSSKSDSDSESESSSSDSKPADLKTVSKSIKAMCSQTDYTDACEQSIGKAANASATSPTDIVRTAVEVIGDAIKQAFDRADLILSNDPRVKAAVADCKEIFGDAKDDLNRTVKGVDAKDGLSKEGYQLRIWLSAVIAHMETCIDGFPDDDFKVKVKDSFTNGKELTSNALALIEKGSSLLSALKGSKRLLLAEEEGAAASKAEPALDKDGIPEWVPDGERRVLKGGGFKNTLTPNVVVAKDGSGKFKTINEALNAMPKSNGGRYVIQVKEGVYEEYVAITKTMVNVTLLGEGSKKSIVTGKKNFVDGLTTFKTATFTAQGDGFMAIGMGFQNTAGPEKHQAVALLVQSDKSIFLNCRMDAFQDTLYAHSKAQFYRNCVISGTIDFIFGDAAAVFQNCILVLRRPMDNQQNIATAQGRADAREATGFVLQKCEFQAETALRDAARPPIRNYLGRPWRECSRTLIMESEIPDFIDKAGYMPWNGDFGLKTLWYAEYGNTGPGATTAGRVNWAGYKKVISKADATKFTVENFLHAQPWIDPTGTPVKYDLFT